MNLLIDAGNTRIKWALAEPACELGQWQASGSVALQQITQLEEMWRGFTSNRTPIRIIVANVAGQEVAGLLQQILARAPGDRQDAIIWFESKAEAGGLRNAYRQPGQLGADRFAAAIGAHAMFPDASLLIATCGTATTVDVVSPDGVFIGGMILPGLRLMGSSLARNTALLPDVLQQSERLSPFADNTEEAIISGCIAAQVGAIERAFSAFGRTAPAGSLKAIVSGGAAASIAPHLAIPYVQVDNLVLIGLQVLLC